MNFFEQSAQTSELATKVNDFMQANVYEAEARFFQESMELGPWRVWPGVQDL